MSSEYNLEHEYVRSELRERFQDVELKLNYVKEQFRLARLTSRELQKNLRERLTRRIDTVEQRQKAMIEKLARFHSDDDAVWGGLRKECEREWNTLTDILEVVQHDIRYAEDTARLPPYLKPEDTLERDYSVSGRI